jgi:murein DD-endopeptidase MepM/ murein hydrolase activator NlpD
MPSLRSSITRAVLAISLLCAPLGAALALGSGPPLARAASSTAIQRQISAGRGQVSGLAGALSAASKRLTNVNASIASLQSRISRIQAELDARQAQLLRLRAALGVARARLVVLEAYETRAARALSAQLVNRYETDGPDLVSVVLEAKGFNDLLERLAFAQRIRDQDARVVGAARAARAAVVVQATRLGALEPRAQKLALQVLSERNDLDRTDAVLVRRQIAVAQTRTIKAGQLASARTRLARFERRLASLQVAPDVASVRSNAPGGGSGSSSGSGQGGGPTGTTSPASRGGFTFPMPKGGVSPPGTWSLDDGVDISAPGGTPEFAVCSGTVVLHGIGGFGPSAPVLHCDSPLSGFDYVYYGHAGPGNLASIGTHLDAGQVISEVGSGIVGISSGPHLEIGFADAAGSPVGPQTAPQMMALLQSAYAG